MDIILGPLIIGFVALIMIVPAVTIYKNDKLTARQKSNLMFLVLAAPVVGSVIYLFYRANSQGQPGR